MLVITLGEVLGVNAELAARALAAWDGDPAAPRVTLVGSAFHWRDQLGRLGLRDPTLTPGGAVQLIDVAAGLPAVPAERLGEAERGALAVRSLEFLRTLAVPPGGRLAVVTAPIDKHACHLAGYAFPGQTEFFEDLWQAPAVMTLAGPRLRVGLATNHLRLADVPKALTPALVERKILLLAETLARSFGIARPRLAVAGLNPHAGDQGLFGDEDGRLIAPAIRAASARTDARISGPEPADTVFYRCFHGDYDGVLAMYHDQGLGPLKTVHFDEAVNLSGGLPHLRVSPDHGPARDLFLTGRASPKSFAMALALARRYLAEARVP